MKTIKLYIILFLSLINISAFSVEHNHINTLLAWADFIITKDGQEINLLEVRSRSTSMSD